MRIGIDVGGTNTDAVIMDGAQVLASTKTPTTPDVSDGITTALRTLISLGEHEAAAAAAAAKAPPPAAAAASDYTAAVAAAAAAHNPGALWALARHWSFPRHHWCCQRRGLLPDVAPALDAAAAVVAAVATAAAAAVPGLASPKGNGALACQGRQGGGLQRGMWQPVAG